MRILRNIAVAVVIGAMGVGPSRAGEVYNCSCPAPSSNVNTLTITLVGNVINQLNLNATATDPSLNPFVNAGGTSTVTAALDSHGNTVVTISGSISVNSSTQFHYSGPGVPPHPLPHFGVDGTANGGAMLPTISQGWSQNGANPFALPGGMSFFVAPPSPSATDIDYVIFYVQSTDPGITVGQWFEEPFDGSNTSANVTLTNYTGTSEALSDAGYYISESYIPLDQLNYGYNPPPGYPGSPFIPLPSLDGQTLPGGDGIGGAGGSTTITLSSVPEPSALISLATGLLIVGGYIGRRGLCSPRQRTAGGAGNRPLGR